MTKAYLLLFLTPSLCLAQCSQYFFSLDFGGRIGDGLEITEYLVEQKVPHMIFMVGKNLETDAAKELCQKIKTDPEYKKYVRIGNHSFSHKGFTPSDRRSYIHREIMGNEAKIKRLCGSENFVKVFRYPKGQAHPLAEKILEENNYNGRYAKYTEGTEPSEYGVGWTADTQDWLKEGAASAWAQSTYFKRHGEFMPVTEDSKRELQRYASSNSAEPVLARAIRRGREPQTFNPKKHRAIKGWHGPTTDQIVEKIINDKGVNGKCVPLAHFGGYNTLSAFKRAVPELKRRGASFEHFKDDLEYVLQFFPEKLDPTKQVQPKACGSGSHKLGNKHTVFPGETLFAISRAYGLTVEDLKDFNRLNDNEIEIGQILWLEPPYEVHFVKPGDTLFRIAKEHGTTVEKIKADNSLTTNEIEIGRRLSLR